MLARLREIELSSASGLRLALVLCLLAQLNHETTCTFTEENNQAAAAAAAAEQQSVRITIQPQDLVAIEGESTELNCDAEGDPKPTIEWYHNGQPIKSFSQSRTTMGGSIQFLDIRPSSPASAAGQSDAGVYYCLAKNQFGEAKSRNATLQVAYIRQQFSIEPRDTIATRGDSVHFDCLPEAWPEPQIQWRFNGQLIDLNDLSNNNRLLTLLPDRSAKYAIQRIASADLSASTYEQAHEAPNGLQGFNGAQMLMMKAGQASQANQASNDNNNNKQTSGQELVDVFGSRLVIKQADKMDEGKYSCVVETKGSHRVIERESRGAQLIVSVKPYFIEAPEHQSAQVGAQVRMRCRMGGDPEPVISWRRQNGQPLSEKITIDSNDKTLVLNSLKVSDQGVYICEGENSAGSARAMAQVSVNSRPRFIVQPSDQEVDIGSKVQLKCTGEASPAPMLYWYKEGHRQLMFPPQSLADYNKKSNFMPQAAALVSTDRTLPISSTISDTSPAINKLFSMPLNHENLVQPNSFNNNYFGNRIYVDNQGTLNIINVTSSDNGYYACALISSVGSVMAKAKLTVKQSQNNQISASGDYYNNLQDPNRANGLTLSGKYDLLPPPVIKMGTSNQTLPTNTSTVLLCDVVSQVAYKIQWLFESQPLQEDAPRVTVLENGGLGFSNLRTSDSGVYTCVVSVAGEQNMPLANPFEPLVSSMLTPAPPILQSTSHSCMLKVANPSNPNIQFFRMDIFAYPSSPGPAYLLSTNGEDAITIAWSPPNDSGVLPVKQYVVEHYDTSQEHLGWRVIHRPNGKESLLIDGLSSDGSHFFIIRATNSHGTGPSSAIAGPMRTIAGDRRYQLELQRHGNPTGASLLDMRPDTGLARDRLINIATNLLSLTPVSSTSIRLQWSTQADNNSSGDAMIGFSPLNGLALSDYLEGYSIRYRAIGVGESLLSKDPLLGTNWSPATAMPSSPLPLVTSYIEEEETMSISSSRRKRDITNYYDFSQEFNEVRIADHNTEHYTINGLRPFTMYQFFVVPYFKDIDGVPSNILSAQTNEDKPSVAPPNLTIRPINNTAIRLLWLHIPPIYVNGILRGYVVRINRSDIFNDQQQGLTGVSPKSSASKLYTIPLASLLIAQLTAFNPESKIQPNVNGMQQFVVMYDIANLTHKSFYSIQVAGSTSVGPGPWSESQNFVMDSKILSNQMKQANNEFDDVLSKSILIGSPQSYENYPPQTMQGLSTGGIYIIMPALLIIILIAIIAGFVLYRRNNQKVITWKKTISEHFTNKFYMPAAVVHSHHQPHNGPGSIQQNIYDHQQHLIYSAGTAHMVPHQAAVMPNQNMWNTATMGNVAPGCLNSSGTGSLSSHNGGLVPINNDPNAMRGRVNNADQILLMNNNADKDTNARFMRGQQLINQASTDSARSLSHQQIIHHAGDYYSVINNVAEYEELDQQQRQNMQLMGNGATERHQTNSSNSDTSCPSSVTRLLPNQNYNRELLQRNFVSAEQQQRQEMILQQQINCNGNEGKQPFITLINGNEAGTAKFQQPKSALSPYATTNLMNQMQQQHQQQQQQQAQMFSNPQMSLTDQARLQQQQNFTMHNGNNASSMDDSAKVLMGHQMSAAGGASGMGGVGMQNPHPFRTLQRNAAGNFHLEAGFASNNQTGPMFMQNDMQTTHVRPMHQNPNYGISLGAYHGRANNNIVTTNITPNPLNAADTKSNFYEHIDYNSVAQQQQIRNSNDGNFTQPSQNEIIVSASTSSGSVRSPLQKQQQQQHSMEQQQSKFKKGSNAAAAVASVVGFSGEEAHDLRVFSSASAPRGSIDSGASERQRLTNNGNGNVGGSHNNDDDYALEEAIGGGSHLGGQGFDDDNEDQADETTAFRRKQSSTGSTEQQPLQQRTRQLSKRKRQQQRSRLHNNNQKIIN